jgi:hypothetical protein
MIRVKVNVPPVRWCLSVREYPCAPIQNNFTSAHAASQTGRPCMWKSSRKVGCCGFQTRVRVRFKDQLVRWLWLGPARTCASAPQVAEARALHVRQGEHSNEKARAHFLFQFLDKGLCRSQCYTCKIVSVSVRSFTRTHTANCRGMCTACQTGGACIWKRGLKFVSQFLGKGLCRSQSSRCERVWFSVRAFMRTATENFRCACAGCQAGRLDTTTAVFECVFVPFSNEGQGQFQRCACQSACVGSTWSTHSLTANFRGARAAWQARYAWQCTLGLGNVGEAWLRLLHLKMTIFLWRLYDNLYCQKLCIQSATVHQIFDNCQSSEALLSMSHTEGFGTRERFKDISLPVNLLGIVRNCSGAVTSV